MREQRRLRILWSATLAWLALLFATLALFGLVGERAWPVVLLLYLPRLPWIIPGVLLLPLALHRGRRVLLVPLAVGALLWTFPLMGFVLPLPASRPQGPTFRLMSYNTTQLVDGVEGIRSLIFSAHPDLVLFQWTSHLADEALSGAGFDGWTVRRAAQFTVASRFPILSVEAVGVPSGSGPPCAHAVVVTPLGPLDVFDIRPQSARMEIAANRHLGLRQRLRQLVQNARSGRLSEHAALREAQIQSIAEAIAKARYPVVIAGDTNLPQGSFLLLHYFGNFQDAFREAGSGFGFTHPAKWPWLRLDRVLLGPGLAAASFQVLSRGASAHRPILAEISRAPSR